MAPAFDPTGVPVRFPVLTGTSVQTGRFGLTGVSGLQFQLPPLTKVAGIDNTLWTGGIDPTVIGTIQRPLKTIVVSQDPPAGTEVPFGTAVNITLASISVIPLNILKNSAGLNFATLGDFQTALSANPTLLASVTSAGSFQGLSAADQTAFTAFAAQHGATDAAGAFGAAKIVTSL